MSLDDGKIDKTNNAAAPQAEGSIVLTHAIGLHARPSVMLTKLSQTFASRIEIGLSAVGPWFNAKSIVRVLAAKVTVGATIFLRAEGDDAENAVAALIELIERDFKSEIGDGASA
jgi:phosphocarrier protein